MFLFDHQKQIVLMLDDFYQIKNDNQPFIIQFLHDVSKDCTNRGFRFKLFAIPGRLILNDQGVDMSYKDDFSPLTIDTDMSNIDFYVTIYQRCLVQFQKV